MTEAQPHWREAPPYFGALEIGAEMESSGRTVTELDIISFSALTGDWHPQHADTDWAARNGFGERVAHGMLVLSYAIGLLPIDSRVVIALRSIERVVLKRPVAIGDSIRARAKVSAKRPVGEDVGLVTLAVRIVNQEDELAARMELTVLWRCEPSASGSASMDRDEDDDDDELSPFFEGRLLI